MNPPSHPLRRDTLQTGNPRAATVRHVEPAMWNPARPCETFAQLPNTR